MREFAVTFTAAAQSDLTAIYDYIAERAGASIAFGYAKRLEQYCLGLSLAPERGSRRDDLGRGVRTVGFERNATILFQVNSKSRTVTILGLYYRGRAIEPDETS